MDAGGAVGDRDGQHQKNGIAAGAPGPLQEMIDPETGAVVRGRARQRKARKIPILPVVYEGDPDGPPAHGAEEQGGQLQGIAAKVLMKILYAARMARTDLLRAVCHLACYITRWDSVCDRRLHRLVAYIASTTDHKLVGWVGDEQSQLQPHLYADADFAGCVATQRSTSGAYLCICAPHTCFPIAANSKRQGCVSKSTPEAEIVSMDFAVRSMGIPSQSLWDTLGFGKGGVDVHEDNMSMVRICETGRNPTMRYLSRTHGVSVAWLHEQFSGGKLRLHYERSDRMRADLLTKAFTDLARWEAACWLINIIHPDRLQEVIELGDRPPPQLGGGIKKGAWYPNADGSGCWSRTDYGCERYRDLYACGPKRAEVTRRITTDLKTGEVLEDTHEFSTSRNRCAPIHPDSKDPSKPNGTKLSLRTDFYYDSTTAVVAASPEADAEVDENGSGTGGQRPPQVTPYRETEGHREKGGRARNAQVGPETRDLADRDPVATAGAEAFERRRDTGSTQSHRTSGQRYKMIAAGSDSPTTVSRRNKWPRCEFSAGPARQKQRFFGTPNQDGQKQELPHAATSKSGRA